MENVTAGRIRTLQNKLQQAVFHINVTRNGILYDVNGGPLLSS